MINSEKRLLGLCSNVGKKLEMKIQPFIDNVATLCIENWPQMTVHLKKRELNECVS